MSKRVKESEAVAKATIALIDMPGVPDFLVDGMTSLLRELQAATGVKLWNGEAKQPWDVKALAGVVESHEMMHLVLEREKDLAELISAVLKHPDLPVRLYNEFTASTNGLQNNEAMDSPEVIRALLAANAHLPRSKGEKKDRRARGER